MYFVTVGAFFLSSHIFRRCCEACAADITLYLPFNNCLINDFPLRLGLVFGEYSDSGLLTDVVV